MICGMFCCQVKLELEKQVDAAGDKECDTCFFPIDVSLPGRVKLHCHTTKDTMDLLWWVTRISLLLHTQSLYLFQLIWQRQCLIVETTTVSVFWVSKPLAPTLIITDDCKSGCESDFALLYTAKKQPLPFKNQLIVNYNKYIYFWVWESSAEVHVIRPFDGVLSLHFCPIYVV